MYSITFFNEEVIDMDQKASDQGWQQLQANIERFLGQSLQSDGRRIRYKPQFIVPSEMSAEDPHGEEALHHPRM
jgi:hypothetical protein